MKRKKWLYTAFLVVGGALTAAALLLRALPIPNSLGGMLMGVGSGLLAMGLANRLTLHWEEKDPAQMRRNEIEAKDERNVAIRNRAKAVSGEVLQWGVMAAAWLSIGLGAPLWVTLLAVGVFVLKSALELYLMLRYQREM